MIKRTLIASSMAAILLISTHVLNAADPQQVYGSELMTQQERAEFQKKMRNAQSNDERQKIRNEHHKRMQIRATEQGVTLPVTPPTAGGGKGPGGGMGGGRGPGDGTGPGGGMGGGKNR